MLTAPLALLGVRDVLVWTKTPFVFRNELVPADARAAQLPAHRTRSSGSAASQP